MSLRAERTEPLYYLPSYTAGPTLNLTLRLSLTLTLLLLHWTTGEQRVTQIVCTRHFVQKLAHQQQVHNKSYKWSVGFNVNGRTFRVIAVRPYDVSNGIHTYITSPHWRRTCMSGCVYNLQGCAVIHWRPWLGPRDGIGKVWPLPHTPPARLSRSE